MSTSSQTVTYLCWGNRSVRTQLLSVVHVSPVFGIELCSITLYRFHVLYIYVCVCVFISACLPYHSSPRLFHCPSGTVKERNVVCVYNDRVCDNVIDCSEGEDEYHCACESLSV